MIALFDRLSTTFPRRGKTPPRGTQPRPAQAKPVQAQPPARATSPYASISMPALIHEVGGLQAGVLPAGSVLVGACEDRVHFYMDLNDPQPGSVLIAGAPGAGQARLLHTILSSAVLLNSHRQLRFAWLCAETPPSIPLLGQPHCYRVISLAGQAAGRAITQLADLAEKRMAAPQGASLLLLAIDGLDGVCEQLDDRAYGDLAWLIRYGPALRIWPFATLDITQADGAGAELIELFGTCLLGQMSAGQAAIFQGAPDLTSQLVAGKQFCVWFEEQWLSFWVPEPAASYPAQAKH